MKENENCLCKKVCFETNITLKTSSNVKVCYAVSYIQITELITEIECHVIGLENSYNKIRFILKSYEKKTQKISI